MNTRKSNLYLLPKDKDMKKLEVLYNSKEFYKLKIEVNNLIEKYSNISTLHNILGLALQNLGDRNSAIVNFRKAIEINPKFFLAYNNLGNAFNDLGQYDDALFQYQQSIIEKLIERVKEVEVQKYELSETVGQYEELLQQNRFNMKDLAIQLREKTNKLEHYEELIPKIYNSR